MERARVIITGGAGFIGSHLVNHLIKNNFEVLVIDNLSSGNIKSVNPKAIFEKLDIRNDIKINKCFEKFLPNLVVHLAGITSKSPSDTKELVSVNLKGTINILKACTENKINKIIFASSAAVYGESGKKLIPINPYGFSKVNAEKEILAYHKKYNLNYSILRYSNVYGPGQRSDTEGSVISIFCHNIASGKPIKIYGDGRQSRDFVYIEDVTRANFLSMLSPLKFIANVSTGKETSILKLTEIIEKISGKKAKIIFKPEKEGEIKRSCLDNTYIKRVLKWQPRIKLEPGIAKTYA